jgi:hypothetical protein
VTQDGSAFALKRVAPGRFGGQPGFRFEYTITRKSDNVLLKGVGQGAVVKGKLYLAAFRAVDLLLRPAPAAGRAAAALGTDPRALTPSAESAHLT